MVGEDQTDEKRHLFVADVHLEPGGGPRTRRFEEFLEYARGHGDVVYVLGDLFDLWLGAGHEADYAQVLDTMKSATQRGLELYLLPGNRDFLMGPEITRHCGATLLPEHVELQLGGQRCLICHGDQFCTADPRYQRLRLWIRSWPVRAAARLLPMPLKRWLAACIKRRSDSDLIQKSEQQTGLVESEIRKVIDHGIDVVICGHAHNRQARAIGHGRLFVLDDWHDAATALACTNGRWEWLDIP
jgi:UDP-2,3-diacylglucosamine hydrolase